MMEHLEPRPAPVLGPPDLLTQIRGGDRGAAAAFLVEHEGLIRRRYRQRLGRAVRRLVDSQDLMSTIARRFDRFVSQGDVAAVSEAQLWALIFRIGDNALAGKARVMARLERVEGPDSEVANQWRIRLSRSERQHPDGWAEELDAMLQSLDDPTDRQILSLWLAGEEHAAIALELHSTPAAIRKRWERIKAKLRGQMEPV